MATDWHEFRDPVHGFVVLNDLERKVVDSRPFQRLRSIKQLATTYMVYPGAVHTRFEHGLGTLEMASRAFDVLVMKGGSKFLSAMGWSSEADARRARQELRLAALLHDVGHLPFSHAAEEELMPDGCRHETFTERMIRETDIAAIIASSKLFALDIDDISYMAIGPKASALPKDVATRFIGELVFGDLGADRIDYLVRDSLHLGVQYGRFDYSRLLNTLTFSFSESGDPVLALEEGGIQSAEGLFLARRFMFMQVYLHDIRVLYDMHLIGFLRELLKKSGGRFPTDLDEYLMLDDVTVEAEMRRASGRLRELAEPMTNRSPFGVAFELYASDRYPVSDIFEQLSAQLADEFGDDIISNQPSGGSLAIKQGDIPIVGTRSGDLVEFSDFTRQLVANPIWMARIYSLKENRSEVKNRCEEIVSGIKSSVRKDASE